jgi:hypothetical protein
MNLLRFLWVSRAIHGGLQVTLRFWLPWDKLLIGCATADLGDLEQSDTHTAFKGSLFIPLFELEIVRIRVTDPSIYEE